MRRVKKPNQRKAWRVAKRVEAFAEYGDRFEVTIDRMLEERRLRSEKCFSWRALCRPKTRLVSAWRLLTQPVFRVAGELLLRLRCVRGAK